MGLTAASTDSSRKGDYPGTRAIDPLLPVAIPPIIVARDTDDEARMSNDAVHTCRTWIKHINNQSLEGLESLASDDHIFFVEGETPTIGRDRVRPSWTGYFTGYPEYVVSEDELYDHEDAVYVVGHTTGSHVPQELESIPSSVIWRCVVDEIGQVSEWSIYPATQENRSRFRLD